MSTTVVVGPDAPVRGGVADALGARQDTEPPFDKAVVCWTFDPDAHAGHVQQVSDLERSLLDGLAATHAVLTAQEQPLKRVVLAIRAGGAGPLASTFVAAVAAFGKSMAREVARAGTTVNSVGVSCAPDGATGPVSQAARYLLSEGAAFVTGQTFGRAGDRLARPMPAGPASWDDQRSVLISGGSGAIGRAITERLHADGWDVVIGYTRREAAQELADGLDAPGHRAAIEPLDLTSESSVATAVGRLQSFTPPVAGLVLCGGWNRTARFADTGVEEWLRTLAINLTGPARLTLALLPQLRRNGGAIVGIASESARIGDAGRAVYAGAKAGLAALLSEVNGQGNVRAATLAPGPIDTPLLRGTHGDPDTAERQIERLRRLVPLGRLGDATEVAEAVGFLLSREGRSLAGEVISVGGGITMQ